MIREFNVVRHCEDDSAEANSTAARLAARCLVHDWSTADVAEAVAELRSIVSERDEAALREHFSRHLLRLSGLHQAMEASLRSEDGGASFADLIAQLGDEVRRELRGLQPDRARPAPGDPF